MQNSEWAFFYFLFLFQGAGGYGVLLCWCLVSYLRRRIICLLGFFLWLTVILLGTVASLGVVGRVVIFTGLLAPWALVRCSIRWLLRTALFFKETSSDQSTVLVFLDVKQPDLVGHGGFVPRERTLKKEKETRKQ